MPPIAREPVLSALRTVLDPEVGVNIVDLGLVYGIDMEGDDLRVRMTMTSAACPLGTYLERAVERAVRARVPDLRSVQVALVWDPPWDPAMMSSEARRQLGWRE
ncbi:MAG TPA: metal-sulfur cluster assembly factor [Terriglobia bacterium]|nr:metal-sulfur cluster assembly factor [Terriglobia bacterium]